MSRLFLLLLSVVLLLPARGWQAASHAAPPDPWLESLAALVAEIPAELPPFAPAAPTPDAPTLDVPTPEAIAPAATPATAPVDLAAIRASVPVFSDEFSEDDGRWSPDEADAVTCSYLDGAYVMAAARNLHGMCTSDVVSADFLYEVDAAYRDGAEYGFAAGLVFRYGDADNYYRFEVDGDGRYRLVKRVAGETTVLLEPVESPLSAAATRSTTGSGYWRLALS